MVAFSPPKDAISGFMENALTFAIGDVHGCFDELRSLLELCRKNTGGIEHGFILLGDYVDRGPASNEVIALLMREQAAGECRFRCLRGNHDEMLLTAAHPARTDADLMQWFDNGGKATLDAYGLDDPSELPADHLAWIRALPVRIHEEERFFVHAGVRPGTPLSEQLERDLLWIREPFLSSRQWHGALVVHGHTPTANAAPEVRCNRVNIDTGACFGRSLTAAAFRSNKVGPAFFINSDGLRFEVLENDGYR
jgi:serine/threonine protein phosphatase 1